MKVLATQHRTLKRKAGVLTGDKNLQMSLRSCVGDLYAHVILEVGGIAKGYKVVNPSH